MAPLRLFRRISLAEDKLSPFLRPMIKFWEIPEASRVRYKYNGTTSARKESASFQKGVSFQR